MQFDNHPNLAIGTITTAPSPFTSGTTFQLAAPEVSLFRVNMPVTIAPAGAIPTPTNAEIGYITGITGTTITFLRAQESTTAKSIRVGWKVYGSATAKTFSDLENAIEARATFSGDLDGDTDTSVVVGAHFTDNGYYQRDEDGVWRRFWKGTDGWPMQEIVDDPTGDPFLFGTFGGSLV